MIRDVEPKDYEAICNIYNYYIKNTTITFEETALTYNDIKNRVEDKSTMLEWIVYEVDNKVVGYAYASRWKARSAYRYSVELSVYIDMHYKGNGIGSKLYSYIIEELKNRRFHSIIGGIALPNAASEGLHEKFGFKKIAHFEQVGYKLDKWIDVGYWQLLLN